MPLLLLLLLGFAACESGTALQLIEGQVGRMRFAPAPTRILATTGGTIVGSAPIELDGSFLLAVPPGTGIRIELEGREGDGSSFVEASLGQGPVELRICAPLPSPLDLGTLRADLSLCPPSRACHEAWMDLWSCRSSDLGDDCINCPFEGCEEEERSYEACILEFPPACVSGQITFVADVPLLEIGCPPQ